MLYNRRLSISLIVLFLIFSISTKAQTNKPKWHFLLDGYLDVIVKDVEVDTAGNSYVAVDYSGKLTVPVLRKKLPYAHHVHALFLKFDKTGKPLWAHALKSAFDNRINDITLAPNGDVLITGFGDGIIHFPGLKDTLKFGKARENVFGNHPQGIFIARYSSTGDRRWAHFWNTGWGEGKSMAVNSKDEVYWSYYHRNSLRENGQLVDSFEYTGFSGAKVAIAKFTGNGKLVEIKKFDDEETSSTVKATHIKFDAADNLYIYGTFSKLIRFSATDSLTNDSYYEGADAYLAKYDSTGKFNWVRRAGGQNYQEILDIDFGEDGSVYAAGYYSYECVLSDGIQLIQKSKYEYKSGNSLFYFKLFADGELAFARYEEQEGYNTSFMASSMAVDQNGETHIVGRYDGDINLEGFKMESRVYTSNFFDSYWNEDKLLNLENVGFHPKGNFSPYKIRVNNGFYTGAGIYFGDSCGMVVNGKKVIFTNKDHGNSAFIYGGEIPWIKEKPKQAIVKSSREQHLVYLKPLLACVKNAEENIPDIWFPTEDSIPSRETWLNQSPCGNKVASIEAKLFPNPTNGPVTLQLLGMKDGTAQVDIFSNNGKLMLSQKVSISETEQALQFDLSNAAAGIYFLRIVYGGFEKALRIVKVE
jgi:hypothetical protein